MTIVEEPSAAQAPAKEVGQPRKRKEDARLITGKTTWTDNMVLPGMLHVAMLRSPVQRGKLGIDHRSNDRVDELERVRTQDVGVREHLGGLGRRSGIQACEPSSRR